MNALFLQDLAQKTHRGLEGRVRQGKSGGGNAFGYDVVRKTDSAGEPIRGERQINESEATVVRRIFELFAQGHSPRSIAHTLNAESVPGPKGRSWQDTTIRGHATRRTGILRNDLYRGQLIWNNQPRYHRADQRHPLGAGLLRDRSHRRHCQHDRDCRERCPN